MAEYLAYGRLTFDGVCFYIDADSKEEAVEKAKRGQYRGYDTDGAGVVDWSIKPGSIEDNED